MYTCPGNSTYIIITIDITIMKNTEISVILPTYNEAGNIIPLIVEIKRNLKEYRFEILVVDDDSPDDTANLVKNSFSADKRIKVYNRKKDKGLAKAIGFGIEKSQGTYLLVMDTDFNHNPSEIPKLLSYKDKFNLVVGSRYISGGGMEDKTRYVLSLLYNLIIRAILNLSTHDNLSGFFLIEKGIFDKMVTSNLFLGYGDYFIRLLKEAHRKHLRVKEIPVFYKNRIAGTSKSKFIPMFVDYTKTVIDLLFQR